MNPDIHMKIEDILSDSSRATADMAVDIIRQQPALFSDAYRLCMAQQGTMALRTARVVQLVAEEHPGIFRPYFTDMVHSLHTLSHSSVKRCTMKVLTFYDLTDEEELHGLIIDAAFLRMNDPGEDVATRAYAIMVIRRFLHIYPEITGEYIAALKFITANAKETLSNYAEKVLMDVDRDAVS